MRVLVTGDRRWHCPLMAAEIIDRLLRRHGPDLTIVHGDAEGVDRAFQDASSMFDVEVEPHPVSRGQWSCHGKAAGPRRNQSMVEAGADMCIAIHENLRGSRGTKDCVRRAIAAGVPTYLIDSDRCEPRRLAADDPRLSGP